MNAIELLKADHERVKDLFRQYEDMGRSAYEVKKQIAQRVFKEIKIHSKLEEDIFYPAVQGTNDQEEQLVLEAMQEHHVVDKLMEELERMDPQDVTYDAKFKVLSENVEHHIREEEQEMFPSARRILGNDNIDYLGKELEKRRVQLMAYID